MAKDQESTPAIVDTGGSGAHPVLALPEKATIRNVDPNGSREIAYTGDTVETGKTVVVPFEHAAGLLATPGIWAPADLVAEDIVAGKYAPEVEES